MPLVELGQEKPVVMQKGFGIAKEKEKIKKSITQEEDAENMASPLSLNLENVMEDAENMASPLSLNLENIKSKDKEGLLQIRANPPSP
ncbi:hypothetical protein like AT3G52110 [Hibiscus trionum]|uniref:Uncharacterized protein n=1 Tax=Hibiscus trionum TaxID=183268 RepID=A0A9W7IIM0_HIBTR|nr:hypothetical protein like AT3G52110 [Hibiscus trionum]